VFECQLHDLASLHSEMRGCTHDDRAGVLPDEPGERVFDLPRGGCLGDQNLHPRLLRGHSR
jgi:hypothetical protein